MAIPPEQKGNGMHTVLATWYLKPGKVEAGLEALRKLVDEVHGERGTLGYLVHQGGVGSLPPTAAEMIVFLEIYESERAFQDHLGGKALKHFLAKNGDLFVSNYAPNSGPYMHVATLDRVAGFLRDGAGQSGKSTS